MLLQQRHNINSISVDKEGDNFPKAGHGWDVVSADSMEQLAVCCYTSSFPSDKLSVTVIARDLGFFSSSGVSVH